MILSDGEILELIREEKLKITPFDSDNVEPSSIDFHLGRSFSYIEKANADECIDMHKPLSYKTMDVGEDGKYGLGPKEFILGTTLERIKLPNNISAFVEGRSSIGRLGIFIQNAGWVDPGFDGEITLEIFNASDYTVILRPGDRIGQFVFAKMECASQFPYTGKYQFQKGAVGSRIYQDFLIDKIEKNMEKEKDSVLNEKVNENCLFPENAWLDIENQRVHEIKGKMIRAYDIFTNEEMEDLYNTIIKPNVKEFELDYICEFFVLYEDNHVYLITFPLIPNHGTFDITLWMKEHNKPITP